jgi:uncharacterized protein (DUF58 family)
VNFARLNHILIPTTKKERDRFRNSRWGMALQRAFAWILLYSDEGRWALLLWLIAGTVSLNVGTTQFYYLFSGATALLVSVQILSRRFRLRGVSLQVDVPRRISVGEQVTFGISVVNDSEEEHQSLRIHTPFLPWDGVWISRPEGISALHPHSMVRRTSIATFSARGAHHLDMFHATVLLPMGLSNGPAIHSRGVRILVVPRIASIKGIDLPLSQRYQPGGVALASITGESRELLGVRPYRPGDPVRDLHAPSWARVGVPVVREYRQEYFTRIGIVVDTDKTVARENAFEAALSLTAGLVSHLSRGEALIDLIVFGDVVHRLMVGRHLGFLDQALDLLASVEMGSEWSLSGLQERIAPHLRRLSAMIFITFSHDEKRARFSTWVSSQGVGSRTLLVVEKSTEVSASVGDFTVVGTGDIRRSEGLVL